MTEARRQKTTPAKRTEAAFDPGTGNRVGSPVGRPLEPGTEPIQIRGGARKGVTSPETGYCIGPPQHGEYRANASNRVGEREHREHITLPQRSRPELAAIARFQDGTFVLAYILLILTYRPMSGRALRNTTASCIEICYGIHYNTI